MALSLGPYAVFMNSTDDVGGEGGSVGTEWRWTVVLALLACSLSVRCTLQFMFGEEASKSYYQAVMKQTFEKWMFL